MQNVYYILIKFITLLELYGSFKTLWAKIKFWKQQMKFEEQNVCLYYSSPAAIKGKKEKEFNFGDCVGYHIFQLRNNAGPEIWKFI